MPTVGCRAPALGTGHPVAYQPRHSSALWVKVAGPATDVEAMDTVGGRLARRIGARSTNTLDIRPRRNRIPRLTPGRLLGTVATLTVAACATVYLIWPDGVGGLAFVAVSAVGLAGLVIGPLARRATPHAGWRWIAAAAGLFLTSLTLRIGVVPSDGSPLSSPDLWSVLGYLAIIRGLYLLVVHSTRGSARSATLDATIVTAGAALGFFSLELGPHLRRGESLAIVLLNISYPALDAAVLALTVHLAFPILEVLAVAGDVAQLHDDAVAGRPRVSGLLARRALRDHALAQRHLHAQLRAHGGGVERHPA